MRTRTRLVAFTFALIALLLVAALVEPRAAFAQTAAEPPPTPSMPPASPAPAPQSECAPGWEEAVYERVARSVVRITRPDGASGAGFVWSDGRHVVTNLHVVDLGRDLVVQSHTGERKPARVVAHDAERDLALLELEAAVSGARPLHLRAEVPIGTPVMAIGHPYADGTTDVAWPGLLAFSVQHGIVSGVNGQYIQTDAQVGPGSSGGPLVTCDGRVVGVITLLVDNRIAFAVRSPFITLLRATNETGGYRGEWQLRDISAGILLQSDVEDWAGAYFGLGVVGHDRYVAHLRLGASLGLGLRTDDPVVSRTRTRGSLELALGYRFLLFPYSFPTYFTLMAGAAGTLDRGEETRVAITYDDAACPGAATCVPKLVSQHTSLRGGGVMPMLGADIKLLSVELGYAFQLDVLHPKLSTQRVIAGVTF